MEEALTKKTSDVECNYSKNSTIKAKNYLEEVDEGFSTRLLNIEDILLSIEMKIKPILLKNAPKTNDGEKKLTKDVPELTELETIHTMLKSRLKNLEKTLSLINSRIIL